jgi:hypothetical protein
MASLAQRFADWAIDLCRAARVGWSNGPSAALNRIAMTDNKSLLYHNEAEKFRRKAVVETCPDAREYYEAMQRDFIKLAVAEAQQREQRA